MDLQSIKLNNSHWSNNSNYEIIPYKIFRFTPKKKGCGFATAESRIAFNAITVRILMQCATIITTSSSVDNLYHTKKFSLFSGSWINHKHFLRLKICTKAHICWLLGAKRKFLIASTVILLSSSSAAAPGYYLNKFSTQDIRFQTASWHIKFGTSFIIF